MEDPHAPAAPADRHHRDNRQAAATAGPPSEKHIRTLARRPPWWKAVPRQPGELAEESLSHRWTDDRPAADGCCQARPTKLRTLERCGLAARRSREHQQGRALLAAPRCPVLVLHLALGPGDHPEQNTSRPAAFQQSLSEATASKVAESSWREAVCVAVWPGIATLRRGPERAQTHTPQENPSAIRQTEMFLTEPQTIQAPVTP